jgi:flagellar assembly protein FliH
LQQAAATRKSGYGRLQVFEYPASSDAPPLAEWGGWGSDEEESPAIAEAPIVAAGASEVELRMRADFDRRLGEETRRSFEAGREKGREEGRQAEQATHAAGQAAAAEDRKQQAARLIEGFSQERERYLRAVEREVVQLALAVSARILRREAQMDPLLLTGAVRVALGQLSGSTQVRLLVPAIDLDLWSEAIAALPNLAVKPTVAAGEGMRLGECVIETELGSVDLGIRTQLSEIERGFFDRAGRERPSREDEAEPAMAGSGRERQP